MGFLCVFICSPRPCERRPFARRPPHIEAEVDIIVPGKYHPQDRTDTSLQKSRYEQTPNIRGSHSGQTPQTPYQSPFILHRHSRNLDRPNTPNAADFLEISSSPSPTLIAGGLVHGKTLREAEPSTKLGRDNRHRIGRLTLLCSTESTQYDVCPLQLLDFASPPLRLRGPRIVSVNSFCADVICSRNSTSSHYEASEYSTQGYMLCEWPGFQCFKAFPML